MKILNLLPPTSLQQNSYNNFLYAKLSGSQITSHWKSRQDFTRSLHNLCAYISLFPEKFPFFSLEEKFHFVSYIIFNDSWKFQDSSSNSKRSVRTHRGWSVSCLTLFVNKISFLKKKKKKKWCAYTSNCLQPKLLDPLLYTLVSQVSCMHNNW